MDVPNPRRILALGTPNSGVLDLLRDLTGSAPDPIDGSAAGLSHTWKLETNYYTAELPIWIDEFGDIDEWAAEFSKPEAAEVVGAVGAWIYAFRRPVGGVDLDEILKTMKAIQDVVEKGAGYGWDGVCLAVQMPQSTTPCLEKSFEEWEDLSRESGFEYVIAEAKGKNEFGEPVGIARVREALEANDWAAQEDVDLDAFGSDAEEGEEAFGDTFAAEEVEMNLELLDMKTAVNADETLLSGAPAEGETDEALQVEELDRMMGRLQAVKDMSAGMPEAERKRFAAQAVNQLMKDFD